MKDFLATVGTIAVDIGTGWVSRYEAGILGPGDTVRASEDCGRAQRVSLNGDYLCDASLAVAEDRFFAKVERFEPETPPPAFPERGGDATELLPFAIRMAEVEIPIGELSGLGRMSFIDLDRRIPADAPEDAELLVAGVPLAAGKVVAVEESFGLRVTRRLAERFEEKEARTTGSLLFPRYNVERIKDYNFRMPDCFTMAGIVKARDMHIGFLKTLASRLSLAGKYHIALVDQLAYYEWAEKEPASGRIYALLGTSPSRERPAEARPLPPKLLARPVSATEALDPSFVEALRSYAERSLRPSGTRPIIAALGGPMASLLDEDPGLDLTASCLRNGWRRLTDLHFERAEISDRLPGEEAAYRNEMILLVSIRSIDPTEGGSLDLVYPLRCLEPFFAALNA